jgi:hypothetical protein
MLEDEVSSNLGRSDIMVTPPKSDEENEVGNRSRGVTRILEFHDVDMEDPNLVVGITFTLVNQFRQAVREYNLFRGKDVQLTKNDGDRVIEFVGVRAMVVPRKFMVHWYQVSWLSCLSH